MTTAAAPTVTQEQVDFYHENGFLLMPKLLPDDVLQALRDETDRIVAEAAGLSDHNAQYDLEDSHTAEEPRVRRLKSPSWHWPFFRELAQHPVLMEVVTALIGPNVRLQNDKLNMKAAEYGAPVEWHQDWPFYPHTNDDLVAAGILLDDCFANQWSAAGRARARTSARSTTITIRRAVTSPAQWSRRSSTGTWRRTWSRSRVRPDRSRSTMCGRCTGRR